MEPIKPRVYHLLKHLQEQGPECEWIEYKLNNADPNKIGKYISGLSNSARLGGQSYGYLVFGVDDISRKVVGTDVLLKEDKVGNEELLHNVTQFLNPKLHLEAFSLIEDGKRIEVLKVPAAIDRPVKFKKIGYVRVNSTTRDIGEFPELEREIWTTSINASYESRAITTVATVAEVVSLLSVQEFFDLLQQPLPSSNEAIVEKLIQERVVTRVDGVYEISICAALLLAKDLSAFGSFRRKGVRMIIYEGTTRVNTISDFPGKRGYAVGFDALITFILSHLPSNEVIRTALRKEVTVYPSIAIREFVANAIVHQNLTLSSGPLIEIFENRIEITNPGIPLIETDRFIDDNRSRNELMADILRRMGICEEKGSGIDKSIAAIEAYQLPAPTFDTQEVHTKVTLYGTKGYDKMSREDRIRACYQHCCLRYVMREPMSNTSLRDRFKLGRNQSAVVSNTIRDTVDEGLIKPSDPESKSRKFATYIPYWA